MIDQGELLKRAGIAVAAAGRESALARAREIAEELARGSLDYTVTSDDIQDCLSREGIRLGNAAGSIFERRKWVCIGYRRSARPSRHSSVIRVWKLRGYKTEGV